VEKAQANTRISLQRMKKHGKDRKS